MELTLWQAALLGALQGLLEWLPVSSSGQLALLLANILHLPAGEAYRLSLASHLGTAASGAVVARREIMDALRLGPWLRITLIPLLAGAPVGLALKPRVEGLSADALNALIGALLLATAILTLRAGHAGGHRAPEELRPHELALVGLLQGLAVLPGLSRSAVTIAGLLLLGLNPRDAVRASFAMGTAATGAAALYTLLSGIQAPLTRLTVIALASLAAGLASAGLMLALAVKYKDRIAVFTAIIAALAIASALPAII